MRDTTKIEVQLGSRRQVTTVILAAVDLDGGYEGVHEYSIRGLTLIADRETLQCLLTSLDLEDEFENLSAARAAQRRIEKELAK